MTVAASQVWAACALLALYGALDQVMAVRPLRRGAVTMSFVIASQIALWVGAADAWGACASRSRGKSGFCISASRRPARWRCASR